MHGFRDWPLTWLFIGATISVDLVMILPMRFSSALLDLYYPKLILSIGVPMQLSLVAIWAATSERYRLVRGAVLTVAVYAAILAAKLFALSRQEAAPYFLAPVLVIWTVTLAMRLLGWLPGWSSQGPNEYAVGSNGLDSSKRIMQCQENETSESPRLWQFSVVELFGWSCIVALWAYALHHAILRPHQWTWWLARAAMVPLLMVVLLGGPGSWRLRCGCIGLVIGLMLIIQRTYGVVMLSAIYLIPAAYLAFWYAVRRLDGGDV